MKKMTKPLTMSERIDRYLETVPRSRPWYDTKNRVWQQGRPYISKRALMAIFLEHRRARAQQALAELDAEIAREETAERRRRARKSARKNQSRAL